MQSCMWLFIVTIMAAVGEHSTQTVPSSSSFNQTAINSLHILRDMLTRRLKARPNIPPQYYTKSTYILLSYRPLQIIYVDEVFQAIAVSSIVSLTWTDSNVGWDPTNFSGIESIDMPANLFWVPSVIVPKATQKSGILLGTPESLQARHDGQVTASIPTLINSLCNFDMTTFPFDTHNCTLVFLDRDFYNITHQSVRVSDLSRRFGTNAAWILLSYSCMTTRTHSISNPFDYVTCFVKLSRRSAFYVANFIGPMVLTSMMTLIVFWLPAKGGEKISFLVSIFTSTFVFLNYIVDMIPRSMEKIPQLNFLLFAIDFQVILATVATAFVLRRYKQEQEKKRHFQQPFSSVNKWFWLPCSHVIEKAGAENVTVPCWKNTNPVLFSRKNSVYPEAVLSVRVASSKTHGRNIERPRISKDTVNSSKLQHTNQLTNKNTAFPLEMDVPGPPEYTPPVRDAARNCLRCRNLTHQELDMLFFVLFLLLTSAIYVYAFL